LSDLAVAAIGTAGGVSSEILHWYGLRRRGRLPSYVRSPFYWTVTVLMVMIGGFLAWLRFGESASPFDAFITGLAAPILLQKVVAQIAEERTGARGDVTSLRDFLVW
jgi:hypothetical protein